MSVISRSRGDGTHRLPHLGRRRKVLAATAAGVAGLLVLSGPLTAAFGQATGEPVVNTSETVKVELDATGKLDVARLFSQIEASGKGRVRLQDPTSTKGLRNLDGWGAPTTRNGKAIYNFDVDGAKHIRTVADFTKDLPVEIRVDYVLNGRRVKPEGLKGKSGKLEVTYHVKNITAAPTQLTYKDGHGKDVTETVDVVTPYVGQLMIELPSNFDDIRSDRADQAGNGRGGRLLTWTMVLFEPIGTIEHSFGFTATMRDGFLPQAHAQIVPVAPERHPELKFGQDGFQSGAATGRELTAGASLIDQNVLKLQAGASQLLEGLTKLQAGASQLNAGLAGQAAPGARTLADGLASGVPSAISGGQQVAAGAADAADGSSQVAAGANQVADGNAALAGGLGALAGGAAQLQVGGKKLADGSAQLANGFNDPNSDQDLIDGSQALAAALGLISNGLAQLNDAQSGLPAAKAGAIALKAGVDQILAGIGSASAPNTILWGLAQLTGGNSQLQAGVGQLQAGADALAGPTGLPAAKDGVDQVNNGLKAALATNGSIDKLAAGIQQLAAFCAQITDATQQALCTGTGAAVLAGVEGTGGLREQTTLASRGLGQVSAGLGNAIAGVGVGATPAPTTLRGGLAQVAGGLAQSAAGLAQVTDGVNKVKAGLKSGDPANPGISEGLDQLVAGLTAAVAGVGQLAPGAAAASEGAGSLAAGIAVAGDGAQQVASGAAQLSGGLDQVGAKVPSAVSGAEALAAGSARLAGGANQLADGLNGRLAPGAQQLADGLEGLNAAKDGAEQLASGLDDAASGSGQIADGLGQATDGNQKIVDGAGQLSEQGTKKLVEAGDETSKNYGKEYAIMLALNEKGATGALPYGAPKGSTDNRGAYDISFAGVGHEGGGTGSTGRGIAGVALLALGAAGATALRRFVM